MRQVSLTVFLANRPNVRAGPEYSSEGRHRALLRCSHAGSATFIDHWEGDPLGPFMTCSTDLFDQRLEHLGLGITMD